MLTPLAAKRTRATARDLRLNNRSTVLHYLLTDGAMSRRDLALRSGLSPATVSSVIAEIEGENLVSAVGQEESSGGRPSAVFGLNSGMGYCVGISLAETHVLFELFDGALHSLAFHEQPVSPAENRPERIVEHICRGLNTTLTRSATPMSGLIGVGVSVPGLVEATKGVSVFAPNWGWHEVNLGAMLRERIAAPLYMDNALKFHAIAEAWFGAGRNVDNMATLVIGTGVGAGVVINGEVYRGTTNSAGEWGHTTIVLDGRPCRCGNRGCVEAYVGAPGIMQTLHDIDPRSPLLNPSDQDGTISAIAAAAREGQPTAMRTLSETTRYLAAGIANLINCLNPELIILGAWVGEKIGPLILPELNRLLLDHALQRPLSAARIVVGGLGERAPTLGAATLALEYLLSSPNRAKVAPLTLRTSSQASRPD